MSDDDYEVPTKDHLLSFAAKIGASDDLLDFEFHEYSDEINRVLLEMREGGSLDDETKKRLSDLYDEWKSEGFPMDDPNYDDAIEGDPDSYPDDVDV